jgi:hypothetical protein
MRSLLLLGASDGFGEYQILYKHPPVLTSAALLQTSVWMNETSCLHAFNNFNRSQQPVTKNITATHQLDIFVALPVLYPAKVQSLSRLARFSRRSFCGCFGQRHTSRAYDEHSVRPCCSQGCGQWEQTWREGFIALPRSDRRFPSSRTLRDLGSTCATDLELLSAQLSVCLSVHQASDVVDVCRPYTRTFQSLACQQTGQAHSIYQDFVNKRS